MYISDCLTDIRQNLAAPRVSGKQDAVINLSELLSSIQASTIEQIKSVLGNLQVSHDQITQCYDNTEEEGN